MAKNARITPALAAFAALGAATLPTIAAAGDSRRSHSRAPEHAQRFVASGIDGNLRKVKGRAVRVRIVTRDTALMRFASKPGARVALSGRLGGPAQALLRRSPSAGRRLAWHAVRKRNAALADLHEAALAAERSQEPVVRAVERVGGKVIAMSPVTNSVTAVIAPRFLQSLA